MAAKKTVALISGANAGIGLATATILAKDHGFHVIVGSRNAEAGQKVASSLTAEGASASSVQLELSSDDSISAAVGQIDHEFGVLDVLINNAGVLLDTRKENLSHRELYTQTFSANVIGAACLTEACLPLLRKSELPRVLFVSSRMGSVSEATNKSTMYYNIDYRAYDCSKAAMNMLAINYDRILSDAGAMVNVVCPGLVQTKLTKNHPYGSTPEKGAQRIVQLATASKGGPSLTFSDVNGEIPW